MERDDSVLYTDETHLGVTPIERSKLWNIHDSSKIQKYMACPRDFFYTHVLGWQHKQSNKHLAFGSGWHDAMEIVNKEGFEDEVLLKAYNAFYQKYQGEMQLPPEQLAELDRAKNPGAVLKALALYKKEFGGQDRPEDCLYTEVPGTAPLPYGRIIHTKMDTIRRFPPWHTYAGEVFSLEHKTTGRHSKAWKEKWRYLFQVGTYNHALHCIFDEDEIYGVVINGAIFRAKSQEFDRIYVRPSMEMWELWVTEATRWIDHIVRDFELLAETKESTTVMGAFPRNSASCSKFGCNHPQLCSTQGNPLRRCQTPPLGYEKRYWDPRRLEEDAPVVMRAEGDGAKLVKKEELNEEDSSNSPSSNDANGNG